MKIKILDKFRDKIAKSNNRDRIIICALCCVVIMIIIGVIFKIIGFDNFIIEENIDINIEITEHVTLLYNTIMFWINTSIGFIFVMREYNAKLIPKLIFLFPIVYCVNYCFIWDYAFVNFIFPVSLILFIKFDFKTIKRFLFISCIMILLQIISAFIKTNLFSFIPAENMGNPFLDFLYNIDLYIIYILILAIDCLEVIKCRQGQVHGSSGENKTKNSLKG